ncbi:MAG TPA: UDP-N-acetylmuramoyl-tripeptide--D-alanyl-D-alanine ligase [Verrucomicrobiae bacterium]|nr:UDP-N-acetylmuramoyl-tripeptide--D-alanyl-D-alanine ligase [Verrucomicrobiae bacterium]
MEARSLHFLSLACGAQLINCRRDAEFVSVSSDSRRMASGVLFWALKGDQFDGHDFVAQAIEAGALAAVVSESKVASLPKHLPLVSVNDTKLALGKFATRYRQDFSPVTIGVAGSNGKTSVKDLIFTVVNDKLDAIASEASFNNDIGVPQTLLRIESKHRAAVLELGTNHPGELAPLIGMVQPKIGVITSIGREHLEFFNDLAGVAKEEGTLAEMLPKNGVLVINGDSPEVKSIINRAKCRVMRVGVGEHNDWRVEPLGTNEGGTRFRLIAPDANWSGEWSVGLLGRHHAINAALAIVVGKELEVGRAEIQRGLSNCRPARMRMQVERFNGMTILNDAYNANADSMSAALRTLAEFPAKSRRIAILGDMAELGETAAAAHREIGSLAGELKIDHVIAIGRHSILTADCARAAGAGNASAFLDFNMAVAAILHLAQPDDLILVKASRSSKLERVVDALRKAPPSFGHGTALAA